MKKIKLISMLCGIVLVASAVYISFAASDYGTSKDPLITLSYLDKTIMPKIESKIKAASYNTSGNTYTPIYILAGTTIYGKEGTEIILRSGVAESISPHEAGISNVTTGTDSRNKVRLKFENLYIVPREDGRGIRAISDCWIMIRGGYTESK